jgi:hypothetical protein
MRPVRIVLVFIALIAVGLAGWALGARGGYGQSGADPAITEAPSAPDDQASQDEVAGGGNAPSGGNSSSGGGAPKPPAKPPVKKVPKPVIERISTVPYAPAIGGFLHLDPGPAQVTFRLKISNATWAQFWLAPTGTGAREQAVWLGEDGNGRDGWTTRLRYTSQPMSGHLIVLATGPGGTVEESFGVTNNGGGDEFTEEGTEEQGAPEDQKATEDQTISEDQKP